jgi:hypothetical protein
MRSGTARKIRTDFRAHKRLTGLTPASDTRGHLSSATEGKQQYQTRNSNVLTYRNIPVD